MAKTFSQLPSRDLYSVERNFRDFGDKTKFGRFTPIGSEIGGDTTLDGYYALFGQMCYYHITINGTVVIDLDTGGSDPLIHGLPYGPLGQAGTTSKVGALTPIAQMPQALLAYDGLGGNVDAANEILHARIEYAAAASGTAVTGDAVIRFSITNAATAIYDVLGGELYVSGWFIRD